MEWKKREKALGGLGRLIKSGAVEIRAGLGQIRRDQYEKQVRNQGVAQETSPKLKALVTPGLGHWTSLESTMAPKVNPLLSHVLTRSAGPS